MSKTATKRRTVTAAEAMEHLTTRQAIDAADFAALTGVAPSTVYAQLKRDEERGTEDFPVRWFRIGQRLLLPSAEVRALLGIDATTAA